MEAARLGYTSGWLWGMCLARKAGALLCLLLTVWLAVAVVAHHHPANTESATCPVCMAARAPAVIPTIVSGPQPIFVALSTVPLQPRPAECRLTVFALSVRPPPEA
jgi:hypothetical protein